MKNPMAGQLLDSNPSPVTLQGPLFRGLIDISDVKPQTQSQGNSVDLESRMHRMHRMNPRALLSRSTGPPLNRSAGYDRRSPEVGQQIRWIRPEMAQTT